MILLWFWYGFDTILIQFWYDFEILIWFWYGFEWFWYGSSELASKKETETAQGPGTVFVVAFSRVYRFDFDMILIWFWYDFDTILIRFWHAFDTIFIRFWYDFDTVLRWFQCVGFKKRNRNSPGTCFWSIFRRSLWFDTLLISLCTFPLWNGLTHVPFQGHFSNKRMHFVRTFFWSTMPFCKKRVFCWANHFVRANFLYTMNLGPIIL